MAGITLDEKIMALDEMALMLEMGSGSLTGETADEMQRKADVLTLIRKELIISRSGDLK